MNQELIVQNPISVKSFISQEKSLQSEQDFEELIDCVSQEYQKACLDKKNNGQNLQEKTEGFLSQIKQLIEVIKETQNYDLNKNKMHKIWVLKVLGDLYWFQYEVECHLIQISFQTEISSSVLESIKHCYEKCYELCKEETQSFDTRIQVALDLSVFYYQWQLDIEQSINLAEETLEYFNTIISNKENLINQRTQDKIQALSQNLTIWKQQVQPVTIKN